MAEYPLAAVHIGTSGWSYSHWANVLYPEGLPAERRLDHYARQFQTVELNASYCRWPSDGAFAGWQRRLPDRFVVTVKTTGAWRASVRGLTASALSEECYWYNFPPSAAFDYPMGLFP